MTITTRIPQVGDRVRYRSCGHEGTGTVAVIEHLRGGAMIAVTCDDPHADDPTILTPIAITRGDGTPWPDNPYGDGTDYVQVIAVNTRSGTAQTEADPRANIIEERWEAHRVQHSYRANPTGVELHAHALRHGVIQETVDGITWHPIMMPLEYWDGVAANVPDDIQPTLRLAFTPVVMTP